MNTFENLQKNIPLIEEILRVEFTNKKLLEEAFIHSSFLNENKELNLHHNENLEFLGDSVLSLIVSEYLLLNLKLNEGELSFLRSTLVSASGCQEFLKQLKLEKFLLTGKGEILRINHHESSILLDSAISSLMVFHSLQVLHWPDQRDCLAPQLSQQ